MSYQEKMRAKQEAAMLNRFYATTIAVLEEIKAGRITLDDAISQIKDMQQQDFGRQAPIIEDINGCKLN